ncbi:MAG: hypothetical protein ACI9NT_002787 [Bacteroidia bacterium]|jgi:hypothetical protein
MLKNLSLAGTIAGIAGALICVGAGLGRVLGMFYLAGFQATTIFSVGVGLMVFACMVKLDSLIDQDKST